MRVWRALRFDGDLHHARPRHPVRLRRAPRPQPTATQLRHVALRASCGEVVTTLVDRATDRLLALFDLPPIHAAAHECGVDLAAAATELIEALSTAVAEQGDDS